jgi:bifunctional DNA-binding transcriptional regulator/antitoxin component of YhaV-PrlF toxin-antitoxin module
VAETTYYKDKMYVPREIKEKLGLVDGDKLEIEIVDKGEARLRVVRKMDATDRLMRWLDNPPSLGEIKGGLTRREIYEDHP